ncbi:fibronectin type-III domain-containing protein 3A-like isoform X2 [Dreissena polymorpha]|uniref:fibronectin type-III domain-containing protein 3A-like isoform X2 n=1 Tax=Dreissena polymorpha TaxID=45954 RepID=UPI002264840A|nr:fibronectin type-III domain-containing protein 3A-like isoform X2 [Dreissena polymorpha]
MSSSDFSEPVHFSKDENGMLETETIPEENGVTKGETKHLNSETTTKATMESEPVQESDNLLISDTIQVSTPCDLEYSEHDSGNYEMDQNVANGDSVVTTNTESIDIDHEIANTYSENACETSGDQQVDVSSHASSQQHQLDVIYTEEQPKTDMTFVPSGLQEPHIYHHTHDPTPYNHDTDHSQTQTHPQVGVFVGTMGPNGPAVVRMLSNNGPPFPMRMQVPPGHVVQQIVDENGILTHVFLSPQHPGMMGNQMPGGPNSPYYPPYSGPYSNHPAPYPTHPHAHPGGPPHRVSTPHMPHRTPPAAATCDNHNPAHTQGNSPPLPNMDERTQKKHLDLRRKIRNRADYNRGQPQRSRRNRENGMDMDRAVSITNSETQTQVGEQNEEYGRALQAELSKMPTPKVSDIEPRSAFIKYYPPDFDTKEFDVNPSKFLYDLMLCEKGRDGKYTCVYQGDASEIALKDLKPATEYHLKVCAVLGDYRGSPTEAISFMTKTCEPDPPQPPKFDKKSKSSISLKWNAPCDNGSKINNYVLEYEGGETEGNFIEVYRGPQKQYRVSRLVAATKYTFRLSAVNAIGQSDYSEHVAYYTSGSCPSQPDPPVLSERHVTELVLAWARRASDDEYSLHMDDEISGHGFIPIYNGTSTSHRITKLYRNKDYKFKLAAVNEEGTSKWSDIVAFRTLSDKPAAPGKPQLKGRIETHKFKITWDPPKDDGGSPVTNYIVQVNDGKGHERRFDRMDRECSCDDLIPGQTYYVSVAACNESGTSDFSDVCTATTQCVTPGQCSVPKLQGKPKATSLHLRWAYPDYNGGSQVSEFAVQMILPDNTSREVYKGRDLDCIVAGLSPGRPYLFQVMALNRAGGGPWSEPLEIVSGPGVPDPPKQPLCQARSAHSVYITWEGPVNNGATITEYRLEWQLKPDTDFAQLFTGSATNFEVKGLSPATSYSFRVQAINSAGPGLYSPIATCHTPPSSPSGVVSIRAQTTATSVILIWKEPHDNGSEIYAYNIDLGNDKPLVNVGAVTEYTVEDLTPETAYKVRVQAVNEVGVGTFSSAVKFTTRALPPRPPRLECCGSSHNSLKLKWGDGRNVDLITFTLEMDKEDGNFVEVYKGQGYNCKVNRLSEMSSYDFRIFASNEAGSGPYSETFTFTTIRAPPPALKAPKILDISLTGCKVEWSACKTMGEDAIVYNLQLQNKDHEYKQIYKGSDSSYSIDFLQSKSEYHVRVCAIRQCEDTEEIAGPFSPGTTFSTLSPEPVKPDLSQSEETKVAAPKQLTDQQLAALFVFGFFIVAVLIAFIMSQFFPGGNGLRDEV